MGKEVVSPLRQRMIEDMNARKLGKHSQRSHIHSCKRFAAFLKRSPETATPDDIRRFQLHLIESGLSICNRNRIMTGVKFLVRVTLRRLDLAAEIYHLREPQKLPQVMSPDETRRLLAVASSLKVRVLLSLGYGCGLRAGEVVRLKVKHIDRAQNIIRIEQSKGRKDRNVMLSPEMLALLRQWWNSFATHLLERGADIRIIQALLGHDKLDTTARYTRVATGMIASIKSPLDLLSQPRKKPRKNPGKKPDIGGNDQPPA
jgi:site-specific recombinase XerD